MIFTAKLIIYNEVDSDGNLYVPGCFSTDADHYRFAHLKTKDNETE